MRIAQVAPLIEPVPPRTYGGTERVASWLTEELVAQGHEVTLFASGDSTTAARLVTVTPDALRLGEGWPDPVVPHLLLLEQVALHADEFDLLHFHTDVFHLPFARRLATPSLTTLHGRLDLPHLDPLYREYADAALVSISDAQREPLPWANWIGTVYHGLPADSLQPGPGGEYLAFLGRIAPEKRVDRAIEIARRCRIPLRVAAKVDEADVDYHANEIAPLLDDPLVDFVGEATDDDKQGVLGGARALVFPIDWPEPFGLVMIEAMACGTPVIAFRGGSVTEVIDEGVTGFVVDDLEGACAAVDRLDEIPRDGVRARFDERFSAERMARSYVEIYERMA